MRLFIVARWAHNTFLAEFPQNRNTSADIGESENVHEEKFIMRQLLVFEGRITEDYSDAVSLRENCSSNSDGLHSKCSETQSSLGLGAFLIIGNNEIWANIAQLMKWPSLSA